MIKRIKEKERKIMSGIVLTTLLAAITFAGGCGGDSGSSGFAVPAWKLGDSMIFAKSETSGGVTTESETTYVVTERTATKVSLTNGTTTRTYSEVDGTYVPLTEQGISPYPDTYGSTTPYLPPPSAGESYEYTSWVPGPVLGTGDYVTTTVLVSAVTSDTVTVPAGTFTARTVTLDKPATNPTETITRSYVSGIGVVQEVTENPDAATTVAEKLKSYDFNGPALGGESNPIALTYPVNYRGRVGTGSLYFKISGLPSVASTQDVYLSGLTDNANLQVYLDAFVTLTCSSLSTGTTDEHCVATIPDTGDLYVVVDGSGTVDGSYFILSAAN